jgi:hypothetical protein
MRKEKWQKNLAIFLKPPVAWQAKYFLLHLNIQLRLFGLATDIAPPAQAQSHFFRFMAGSNFSLHFHLPLFRLHPPVRPSSCRRRPFTI